MKVDILVFAAHPDDAELSCSGTILAHKALGKSVALVDLTKGELGTRGNAELRMQEAAEASKILGIDYRENLGFRDGFFVKNEELELKIIQAIRKYQPEIVLANALSDRHIDHGRAADLVHDSCFLSGLTKIHTEYNSVPQKAWRPKKVYHYIQDQLSHPDIVFDISDFFDQKMESILAFKSQFFDPNSDEPNTPISGPDFLDFIKGRAVEFGRRIGVKYGEGFQIRGGSIGSNNLLQQL
ncbi:MAG: bacillithiol biosynthesis deacetylase BshB1 [Bacteroidia bacterium]|nr:bacillithiol biosynthesis deacetylase BshB1 [Bacteroidia bacterium]